MFPPLGYCNAVRRLPPRSHGTAFLIAFLRIHGFSATDATTRAAAAIERVGLTQAADRKVAGYSKGYAPRIKLATPIAHQPSCVSWTSP
jgi:ABC-2 type transport system ATP-binding protein